MAKHNKFKQKQTASSVTQNTNVEKKLTPEDVAASTNQAEFDAKKEALIKQMNDELATLDSNIKSKEKEKNDLTQDIENLKLDKKTLESSKKELEKEVKQAQQIKDEADNYDKKTRKDADVYYQQKKEEADKNSLEIVEQAHKEAENKWDEQLQDIKNKFNELAKKKGEIENAQIQKIWLDAEKDEVKEQKNELANLKERYLNAHPEKIEDLKISLNDEKNKYKTLLSKYNDKNNEITKLQVIFDSIKGEVFDEHTGKKLTAQDVWSKVQEISEEYNRLKNLQELYPDESSIKKLEEKALKFDELKNRNDHLELSLNQSKEELTALKNGIKELEIIKQEVDATNALNEHLLYELRSHKTALESRTGDTCPSLSKVDAEVESSNFNNDIAVRKRRPEISSLSELVTHVRNYAGSRPKDKRLFYTENDIRAFLSGMAVSRLILLEGMSGTGKSSLPRIFSEAISGFNKLIPVESSWRDRNELLGYYNDFNKKFNAKTFTIELYRRSKRQCNSIPSFIVLDEMNLARIEYYFSDFLAILQEPDHEKWLIELVSSDMRTLPMELPENFKERMKIEDASIYDIWKKIMDTRQGNLKSETTEEDKNKLSSYLEKLNLLTGAKDLEDGRKVRVTDNIWFIGTANKDESTFEISDKVYDRAQIVSLNKKGTDEGNYLDVNERFISVEQLSSLFDEAISANKYKQEVVNRLNELDNLLINEFDLSFGNRIVTQAVDFAGVFTAAGGTIDDALDYQISTKILRKVLSSDNVDALEKLQEKVSDYKQTEKLLKKEINNKYR